MELEELKTTWQEMSRQIDKQQTLTNKMIMEMTKLKLSNKIRSIANYEVPGAIVLLIVSVYIVMNFNAFDTALLQIAAVITLLITVGLPILSLRSIYKMNSINIADGNSKNILTEFTNRRAQFLRIQKLSVALSFVLMFTILPVLLKLSSGKDFFSEGKSNLLWYLPIGLLVMSLFARWVYKCYSNITDSAQKIIKDLEEE